MYSSEYPGERAALRTTGITIGITRATWSLALAGSRSLKFPEGREGKLNIQNFDRYSRYKLQITE